MENALIVTRLPHEIGSQSQLLQLIDESSGHRNVASSLATDGKTAFSFPSRPQQRQQKKGTPAHTINSRRHRYTTKKGKVTFDQNTIHN
jgi:hypothetical protein